MKLKDYKGSYPIMLCSALYGGCDNVYPLDDAPEKCTCGAERGVFPFVEYTVFRNSSEHKIEEWGPQVDRNPAGEFVGSKLNRRITR